MAITYEQKFNGYSINTSEERAEGCDTKILKRLQEQTKYMTETHCKVLQLRFDFRYPQDFQETTQKESKKHVSKCQKNLIRNLDRNNKIPKEGRERSERRTDEDRISKTQHRVDPMITLVIEEHDEGKHPHVHALIQVNGNAKQKPFDIQKRAEREWATALDIEDATGLVHYCNSNGPGSYLIDRNKDFEATRDKASKQASYLAKTRGKEGRPKGTWSVTGTRIPKSSTNDD